MLLIQVGICAVNSDFLWVYQDLILLLYPPNAVMLIVYWIFFWFQNDTLKTILLLVHIAVTGAFAFLLALLVAHNWWYTVINLR